MKFLSNAPSFVYKSVTNAVLQVTFDDKRIATIRLKMFLFSITPPTAHYDNSQV